LGYFSQNLFNSTVPLTDFQFLRNVVTNCISHIMALTHGAYVVRDVKLCW